MQLLWTIFLTAILVYTPDPPGGIVFFSIDNGNNWTNYSEGIPNDVNLTDIASDHSQIAISTKKHGIFTFDFVKNNWRPIPKNPPTKANLDVLFFHNKNILVGTQNAGIYRSVDQGRNWKSYNAGLANLTIRRIVEYDHILYACTNAGLYRFDDKRDKWILAWTDTSLQVNGLTALSGDLYIGTTQGVYKQFKGQKDWIKVLANHSLHNISTDGKIIFAMTYNELFASNDQGLSWYSDQKGMPTGKYTFQVMQNNSSVLAGQWDGVYKKGLAAIWVSSNKGLPEKFPVTELKAFKNIIVVSSSGWVK